MTRSLRRRIDPAARARAVETQSVDAAIATLARRTAQPEEDGAIGWTATEEDGLVYFHDEHGRQTAVANTAMWRKLVASAGRVRMREVEQVITAGGEAATEH